MLEPSGLFSLCRQYRLRTVFTRSNGRIHAHGSHRSSPKSLVYHFDRLTSDVYLGMKQSIQPLHHTILITRVYVNDYCESRMGVSLIKKGDFVQLTMSYQAFWTCQPGMVFEMRENAEAVSKKMSRVSLSEPCNQIKWIDRVVSYPCCNQLGRFARITHSSS